MTEEQQVEAISDYIKTLPDTPEGIVILLSKENIKGTPECPTDCPIYHLLKKKGFEIDNVTSDGVIIKYLEPGQDVGVWFPTHVSTFIENFDCYFYPELEK